MAARAATVACVGLGELAAALAGDMAMDETLTCFVPAGPVRIERWTTPLTAHLSDGRSVRLADLCADEPVAASLPVGDALLYALSERDRWGRLVGDLVPEATGLGLRAFAVVGGLAFIDPAAMPEACDDELRKLEREAERARAGLWDRTETLNAQGPALAEHTGRMVLVSGRVASVGVTRRTVYLNFGEDYRTDFTAMIDKGSLADWALDPTSLQGMSVRIRGVLEEWNGGLIRVDHPAQIERGVDLVR